jgi:flagellar protein FliO/FliZ
MLQVLLGLIVVLGLMAGAAWLLKRMGVANNVAGNVARVVGGVNVGNRERVLVVEVADQWIVVGVAPGRVSALSTMPRQEQPASQQGTQMPGNFAAWLKQTIDKRNGNQH